MNESNRIYSDFNAAYKDFDYYKKLSKKYLKSQTDDDDVVQNAFLSLLGKFGHTRLITEYEIVENIREQAKLINKPHDHERSVGLIPQRFDKNIRGETIVNGRVLPHNHGDDKKDED